MDKKLGAKRGAKVRKPQRRSARMKAEIVLRLLKGESLDELSREIEQPVSKVAEWRDAFLSGGEQNLKTRTDDPETAVSEEERLRLRAKVGETLMENELLREKIERLEQNAPFGWRRSKR